MSSLSQLSRGERKSLAYHQVVAVRLSENPSLINVALDRLRWYRERNLHSHYYYDRWEHLLNGPLKELCQVLTDSSAECCALRQENPFVDLITQQERAAIYQRVVDEIDGRPSHHNGLTV